MWLYLVYYFPKLQECCHNDDEAMDDDGGDDRLVMEQIPGPAITLHYTSTHSPLSTQRAHLTAFKTSNMKRMVSLLTHGREIYHSVNRLRSFVSSCHHVTKTATANTILAPHTLDIWINILNCMDSVYFVDNTQYYVNVLLANKGWL